LGAAALVIAFIAAVAVLQHPANPAGTSVNASVPPPTASPVAATAAPTPAPAGPPVPTELFTSTRYGMSIKYPDGWKTTPGRIAWTMPARDYLEPLGDLIEDPTHEFLWLKLASTPIGTESFDAWAKRVLAGHGCEWVPMNVTIDGVQGLVDGQCHAAVAAARGRGYLISAHLCPCELGDITAWNAWFSNLLSTVKLEPETAADQP
jgi:hypothetical protein